MIVNKDDNELFKFIIKHDLSDKKEGAMVELVIRPECNQKCKYCYLVQYGCESYPERFSNEQIITNLNLLVDNFIQEDYVIKSLELFAGDMFYDNLFFKVMDVLRRYYVFLNDKHRDFLEENHKARDNRGDIVHPVIIIPCNMSFCSDSNKIEQVKTICNEFQYELGIRIFFSYSTDGFYSIDAREQKSNLSEEYFNTIFKLCEEMNWGVHPMISYESIDHAIDSYKWFIRKMEEFTINYGESFPSYLEVRNDGWTKDSLNKFKEFLNYYLNDLFHSQFNSDLKDFFWEFFTVYSKSPEGAYIMNPGFTGLGKFSIVNASRMPCSIGYLDAVINLGDLSLLACHRLAYPEMRGGKFIQTENGLDLEASEFLNTYLNIRFYNHNFVQKCLTCDYNLICLKGCLGAQYEKYGDFSVSIPSVCDLFKAKYDTMIEFYHSIGMFHFIFSQEPKYPYNSLFQQLLLRLGYEEYQIYQDLGDFSDVQ